MIKNKNKNIGKIQVSKEELEWRENVVYDFHLWGYTQYEIVNYVNNGGLSGQDNKLRWDISRPSISRLLSSAKKRIFSKLEDNDIVENLKSAKRRWESLIRTAINVGSLDNVRLCQKELDRLNGLEQININLNIKSDLKGKSDAELLRELEVYKDIKDEFE